MALDPPSLLLLFSFDAQLPGADQLKAAAPLLAVLRAPELLLRSCSTLGASFISDGGLIDTRVCAKRVIRLLAVALRPVENDDAARRARALSLSMHSSAICRRCTACFDSLTLHLDHALRSSSCHSLHLVFHILRDLGVFPARPVL